MCVFVLKDLGETQLPHWPSSQGQDCMLTVVSTKRTADVAQLLTEHKGQDSLSAAHVQEKCSKLKYFCINLDFFNHRHEARQDNSKRKPLCFATQVLK